MKKYEKKQNKQYERGITNFYSLLKKQCFSVKVSGKIISEN